MTRRPPPNRRNARSTTVEVDGHQYEVGVGYYDSARTQPCEVFIQGAKPGSQLDAILADCGVVLSLALQEGMSPGALAKPTLRLPEQGPEGMFARARLPASPIGAVLDMLVSEGAEGVGPKK